MLPKLLRLWIFIFFIFKYVMYVSVCEDSQTTAYTKHIDTSKFWLLKTLLQMNFNSKVIQQKQKQNLYMKIDLQNSIVRLSFFCRRTDIKIAWINPSMYFININIA